MSRALHRGMKAFVVVALLASGCVGGSKSPGFVAGTAMSAVGAGLLLSANQGDCSSMSVGPAIECGIEETTTMAFGGLVLAAGVVTLLVTAAWPTPDEAPIVDDVQPRVAVEPATSDPVLRELTIQASVAARAGHCFTVDSIAQRIEAIDSSYRRAGFVADPLVAACLD